MSRYVIAYVSTAIAFLGLDAIWLSFAAAKLYRPYIGDMIIDGFRPGPAAAFYLLYMLGVVLLAIMPALAEGDWRRAAMNGAMFGFFAYATYDLTNQATLKQWSTIVTVVDMTWGAFATCIGATVGYAVTAWFVGRAAS
jgi:uncharacterized membrane protein